MIKNLLKTMSGALAALSLVACNDFFDLQPTNEMVLDEFWLMLPWHAGGRFPETPDCVG